MTVFERGINAGFWLLFSDRLGTGFYVDVYVITIGIGEVKELVFWIDILRYVMMVILRFLCQ